MELLRNLVNRFIHQIGLEKGVLMDVIVDIYFCIFYVYGWGTEEDIWRQDLSSIVGA